MNYILIGQEAETDWTSMLIYGGVMVGFIIAAYLVYLLAMWLLRRDARKK